MPVRALDFGVLVPFYGIDPFDTRVGVDLGGPDYTAMVMYEELTGNIIGIRCPIEIPRDDMDFVEVVKLPPGAIPTSLRIDSSRADVHANIGIGADGIVRAWRERPLGEAIKIPVPRRG